jgi:hypothetical protein
MAKKGEFLDRLNISLNTLVGGKLLIRTLVEKSCRDVFLNKVAAVAISSASRKTTPADPLLPLPAGDYWYYLNSVLNEVAERFAEGAVKRDMGLPVTIERYLICLTSEAAGEIRTRKVRAMVVQKKLLTNLPAEPPKFERPTHSVRWESLKILSAIYAKSPEKFLDIEICV